jgi:aminoglycoside phosphotransferase (APT) family kinase protein
MEAALSTTPTDEAGDKVREGLQNWLSERLPHGDQLVISDIAKPTSGFSAETWLIDLADAKSGAHQRRVVARIETADPAVYPQQAPAGPGNPAGDVEVALQYEIMQALHKAGTIPLAGLIGYEADPSLLGQPFFVMDFVGGDVPKESPPYPTEGFFTQISPQTRETMLRNGLEVVARLHSLDWRELGLQWLVAPGVTPGTDAQMAIWKAFAETELAGREHPLLADAWRWLAQKTPAADEPRLAWGDPRPGNIIWRDGEVATITDFEAASIAPPQQDLGWWLMFDRTMHDVVGAPRLPGDLTREEQCDIYATISGHDVTDISWWEIFAAARYCAIVVRVMNRAVARGLMPADQQVWLHNPAADALAQLLER